MKKSEIFKLAEIAVADSNIPTMQKVEVLKVLIREEDSALYWEEKAEEKKKEMEKESEADNG